MKTTLQRVSLPPHRRVLITSDIHGHADGLRAILKKARFTQDDILIIVGDLVEKGPQSLETIRLAMELQKEYTAYVLMGNVDLWRWEYLQSDDPAQQREMRDYSLRAMEWWGGSLLHEMCAEIGVSLQADTDIEALFPAIRRHFAKEIAYLSNLPTILETEKYIFVHGGIPHERLDELVGTDAFPLLKFDDFYHSGLSFQKYVFVGHWPAVLYSPSFPDFRPLIDRQRRVVFLDGACGVKYEGQLNLLILPDGQSEDFQLVTWDHLPVLKALDAQAGSPPQEATYIRWSDRWVTIARRGEEMSDVMYHGKRIAVPTQYLGRENGRDYCRDATDYVLPVSPGDELLLILQCSHGCFVKKDSIAGWYYGKYEMKTEVESI